MDLGIFMRNRTVLLLWLVIPALAVVIIDAGSLVHALSVRRMLVYSRAQLNTVAELEASSTRAEKVIIALRIESEGLPSVTTQVDGWLNSLASDTAFTVETLSVSEIKTDEGAAKETRRRSRTGTPVPQAVTGLPSILVNLKGRGSLPQLVEFVKTIETSYSLVHMCGITANEASFGKIDGYNCNMTFRIYLMKG